MVFQKILIPLLILSHSCLVFEIDIKKSPIKPLSQSTRLQLKLQQYYHKYKSYIPFDITTFID